MPFPIATEQPKYWVYFDPNWDWKTLTYANYEAFFQKTVQMVGPVIATDNPDLSAFAERGGKLLLFHGWSDPLIMPEGTTRYFDAVRQAVPDLDEFAKLFMVPGMGHCSGGPGPNRFGFVPFGMGDATDAEHDIFTALMTWSERDVAPQKLIATKYDADDPTHAVQRTRPLCPYPRVAGYDGSGSIDDATNFTCTAP
jgi:hypothetical protein